MIPLGFIEITLKLTVAVRMYAAIVCMEYISVTIAVAY